MEILEHISSPLTEVWVPWVMLAVLTLLALTGTFSEHALGKSFKTLFVLADRSSTFLDLSTNKQARMLLISAYVLVLALAIYMVLYIFLPLSGFGVLHYGMVLGVTAAFFALKALMERLVGYVFVGKEAESIYFTNYYYVLLCMTLVLWVGVLVALPLIWIPEEWVVKGFLGGMGLFYLMVLVKLMQLFVRGVRSLLYTLIFIVTCELIPFFGTLFVCWQLVTL